MRPLLPTDCAESSTHETFKATFVRVMKDQIDRILAILQLPLPFRAPERPRMFTLLALELVGHPEERAENDGAVVAVKSTTPALTTRPPSSIRCRVRLRRSTCQARMSCRACAV